MQRIQTLCIGAAMTAHAKIEVLPQLNNEPTRCWPVKQIDLRLRPRL